MAKAKKSARKTARGRASARRSAPDDAIALLKADHRQVENWFEQFESSRSDSRKEELARKICQALQVHTQIEQEIFYPAFLEATQEEDIHHEAEVEHAGAKKLIAEIEASGPDDDYYDAKVTVLSEMIKHHVNEEEKRDGMFAKARQSDMDLGEIGERLASRKQELMGSEDNSDEGDTARRSRASAGSGKQDGAPARSAKRFGS
jgi:hypothetical protein